MAKAKKDGKPVTEAQVRSIVDEAVEKFARLIKRVFDRQDERFDGVDKRFGRFELENKQNWHEQREFNERIEKKVDMLDRSVQTLDKRVRYQKDMPERLEQVENDTYDLKRRVAKVEEKVGS